MTRRKEERRENVIGRERAAEERRS